MLAACGVGAIEQAELAPIKIITAIFRQKSSIRSNQSISKRFRHISF
jgi:hypothetical protein